MIIAHMLEFLGSLLIIFAPPIFRVYGKRTSDYSFWVGLSLLGVSLAIAGLYIGAFLLIFFGVFNIIMVTKEEGGD